MHIYHSLKKRRTEERGGREEEEEGSTCLFCNSMRKVCRGWSRAGAIIQ